MNSLAGLQERTEDKTKNLGVLRPWEKGRKREREGGREGRREGRREGGREFECTDNVAGLQESVMCSSPPPSLPPFPPSYLRPAHGVDQECLADQDLEHVLPNVFVVLSRAQDQVAEGGREGGGDGMS